MAFCVLGRDSRDLSLFPYKANIIETHQSYKNLNLFRIAKSCLPVNLCNLIAFRLILVIRDFFMNLLCLVSSSVFLVDSNVHEIHEKFLLPPERRMFQETQI